MSKKNIIGDEAIEPFVEGRRPRREIAAHAHTNQHHLLRLRMVGEKRVNDRNDGLFPFMRRSQTLVSERRTLSRPIAVRML
jgi:hypothetical protein